MTKKMLDVRQVPGIDAGAHRNFSHIKYMGKEGIGFRRFQMEYLLEISQLVEDKYLYMFYVD